MPHVTPLTEYRLSNPNAILRVEFTMPNGDLLEREWTLSEYRASDRTGELSWLDEDPPKWLQAPRRTEDLDKPITFTGRIAVGSESAAQTFVENGREAESA